MRAAGTLAQERAAPFRRAARQVTRTPVADGRRRYFGFIDESSASNFAVCGSTTSEGPTSLM